MNKDEVKSVNQKNEAATEQVKVVFTPSGRHGLVPIGTTVLSAARQLGLILTLYVVGGRCVAAARLILALAILQNMR